jgi:hypothetical protein
MSQVSNDNDECNNSNIYKSLINDKIIIKAFVETLPSKLRLFPLYSINNLEPILIESNTIPPQLEQRLDYFSNPIITPLFESREKIVAILQKSNLDEKEKTNNVIIAIEHYIKDLLSGEFFNTINYTTKLNNNVKYGIFLWGHHNNHTYYSYIDPWSINKTSPFTTVNFSQLPSSILAAENTTKQSNNKSKEKPQLVYTMLYPKDDFVDKDGKHVKKIHHKMANSLNMEKFYMYYNLTVLYLKKFILKLKSFDDPLFNEIEKEDTSTIYKETLSLLHIKAKNSLSCCINLVESKFVNLEELESLTSMEYTEQKPIFSIKFLRTINSILIFFGQILMFIKAFIKLPPKTSDKLEETNYLLVSILNYLNNSFLKSEEFILVFKTLFGDTPPIFIVESLINLYTSYLCYSKFFIGNSVNYDDIFVSEAIFYLEQSKNLLKIKQNKEQKLDDMIFKLAFSGKNVKLDNGELTCRLDLLKRIEAIYTKLVKINQYCYYQILIQTTPQEITTRKKQYRSINSMKAYIYENSYNDITSGENTEQFLIELTELLKKHKSILSTELLNKKISDFV